MIFQQVPKGSPFLCMPMKVSLLLVSKYLQKPWSTLSLKKPATHVPEES